MAQQTVFDLDAALAAKNEAIRAVERSSPDAIEAALQVVQVCARTMPLFSTDDVWRRLEEAGQLFDKSHRRFLGAAMQQAAKLKWCEATAEYRPSARVQCHGRPVRMWRSRLVVVARAS
jgi:hypothetical protein